MVKRQWKETCFRKGISVYFVANPTGCQVHNPVTILFPISIKKALPISGQGQQPVSPKLLLCFLSPLMANIAEMFSFYWQFSFPFVVFLFVWIRFRYQCTRMTIILQRRVTVAQLTQTLLKYIFSESLIIVDSEGLFTNVEKIKVCQIKRAISQCTEVH